MARIRAASNYDIEPLVTGWQLAELNTQAGTLPASPEDLARACPNWQGASCPGTVASALRGESTWDFGTPRNFDASDWWYRTGFSSAPCAAGESLWLELDGLATLAEVWLNGVQILRSDNMFLAHEVDVSSFIRENNELVVRFSSLDSATSARRPRPRFKTRLVERQQLRWFRTTLLGRIPGWSPPVTAVGPWRAARLVRRRSISVRRADLQARLESGRAWVNARLELEPLDTRIESATLLVGSQSAPLTLINGDLLTVHGQLEIPDAERWWPHSHGSQPRYPARICLTTASGTHCLDFDALAFRSVRAETDGGRFALVVNDREIRCLGACWTPSDIVSLNDDPATIATVQQAREAGMNMLRIGGTMIYESDAFYEECDRAGILVWQDFMFANCDYPGEDPTFSANVIREAEQFLAHGETRACLAVLCGNSEIEQQVAMLGLPREAWQPPLFQETLRRIAGERRPDVPYIASTPTGGTLPFQADVGLTHYYGVGAYLRPLEDARRADVKFSPECLGFANIPEDSTLESMLDGRAPFHDPRWKARVPRDTGPGWDFDDVRDHYTRLLFGVDPVALRYQDPERALALGRVTSGEVMARTINEWRRADSNCRGALIWFLRDLWPGTGWGLIDALGVPKAAYHYVRRAMQPQSLFFSDEGLNGLRLHLVNDSPRPLRAGLELTLIRNGSVQVAIGSKQVEVVAHGAAQLDAATLFDHFIDLTHAYRFGPRPYDVALARVQDSDAPSLPTECCYFPGGLSEQREEDLGLEVSAEPISGAEWRLRLRSRRFAHAVALDLPEFVSDDSYFSLSPGRERVVSLRAKVAGAKPRGWARPLNAQSPTRISLAQTGDPER